MKEKLSWVFINTVPKNGKQPFSQNVFLFRAFPLFCLASGCRRLGSVPKHQPRETTQGAQRWRSGWSRASAANPDSGISQVPAPIWVPVATAPGSLILCSRLYSGIELLVLLIFSVTKFFVEIRPTFTYYYSEPLPGSILVIARGSEMGRLFLFEGVERKRARMWPEWVAVVGQTECFLLGNSERK